MCGRYYIPPEDDDTGFQVILDQLRAGSNDSPLLAKMKRGEIFPSDIVPAVTRAAPILMKWGFSRFDGKGLVINARLETAEEKPMFKKAYERNRCLIPAGYYFEWQKYETASATANAGAKAVAKHKFAIGSGAPIYMAGLYKSEPDSPAPLFVILTRPAAPGIAFIHDRMPVIVPEDIREKWLMYGMRTPELLEASDENMKYRDAV